MIVAPQSLRNRVAGIYGRSGRRGLTTPRTVTTAPSGSRSGRKRPRRSPPDSRED